MIKNTRPITLEVTFANGLLARSVGLIGKRKAYGLVLKTRFGIHTMGMVFPIDVLILDNNNFVYSVRENLLPNNIYLWNPRFDTVIELPAGTIRAKKIGIGSSVRLIGKTKEK